MRTRSPARADGRLVARFARFALFAAAVSPLTAGAQATPAATLSGALPTVVVEDRRLPASGIAGSTSLDRDTLLRMPGAGGDPLRAVQALPGMASVNDASAEPAVRGARPMDNAYYIDFLPVGYLFHAGGLTSVLNGDLVRRFDLHSAAWSPAYGDVVGAVFDVSLRNPRTDRIGGKLDIGLLGASLLVEGPLSERLSFFLSTRRSWLDLAAKTVEDRQEGATYSMPTYGDTQGRLLWTLNADHRLRVDLGAAADRAEVSLDAGGRAAQRDPVLTGRSTQRQSYGSLAATWEAGLGATASNTLSLGQMRTREAVTLGGAGGYTAEVATTYLREQWQWQPSRDHLLVVGGSVNDRAVDLDLDLRTPRCTEFDPDCSFTDASATASRQRIHQAMVDAYLSHRWRFAPAWTATGGVRLGHDGWARQRFVEPRVGLEWAVVPGTVLSAGIGRHNQPPPAEQSLRDIGNPSLAHLRSTHAVIGLTQTLGAGWSWRAEAYAKTFDGYAVADPVLNYRNGASGSAQGIELLLKKDASGPLSGFASVSLARARRTNDLTGERFPFEFDQPVIVSVVGQYKLDERLRAGVRWGYHTGSPYTPVVGIGAYPDGRVRPLYGSLNSERLPAYHRLDLRLDWKRSDRVTVYAELINAYGRRNLAGYAYGADYQSREPVYQLPRMLATGIQIAF